MNSLFMIDEKTRKKIIKIADRLSENDRLILTWSGGNDSGGYNIETESDYDSEEAELLYLVLDNVLDYGSWAGDFEAEGSVTYDRETKTFKGNDEYKTTQQGEFDTNIEIKIPDDTLFDEVLLMISYHGNDFYEENSSNVVVDIDFSFSVLRGPIDPADDKTAAAIEKDLTEKIKEAYRKEEIVSSLNGRAAWQSYTLKRPKRENGFYTLHITKLYYLFDDIEIKPIEISLK